MTTMTTGYFMVGACYDRKPVLYRVSEGALAAASQLWLHNYTITDGPSIIPRVVQLFGCCSPYSYSRCAFWLCLRRHLHSRTKYHGGGICNKSRRTVYVVPSSLMKGGLCLCLCYNMRVSNQPVLSIGIGQLYAGHGWTVIGDHGSIAKSWLAPVIVSCTCLI
ncbi:hypothetical protein BC827DRAFT_1237013 [Russula dissimulans]|jgi:hypothetical protein|nr:hypothetical protein BC827DRAFT_1237013 [Russula dissimulans]